MMKEIQVFYSGVIKMRHPVMSYGHIESGYFSGIVTTQLPDNKIPDHKEISEIITKHVMEKHSCDYDEIHFTTYNQLPTHT